MNPTTITPSLRLGYLYAILAAILWGVSGSSAKFLFNSGVTPFQLVQLRITIAASGLFVWLLIRDASLLKIARKDILYFALFGTIGMGMCQFTYLFAISKINVAAAILLHYTGPVFVALYASLIQKYRLGARSILAILGSVIGCFFVVGAYNLELLNLNILAHRCPPFPLSFASIDFLPSKLC